MVKEGTWAVEETKGHREDRGLWREKRAVEGAEGRRGDRGP
jgi:hypothetical protein